MQKKHFVPCLFFFLLFCITMKASAFTVNPYSDFGYQSLNSSEKQCYIELAEILTNHETEQQVSTLESNVVQRAYDALMADEPRFFYVDHYVLTTHTRNDIIVKLVFKPFYTMDWKTANDTLSQIDYTISQLVEACNQYQNDYDKAKLVFSSLVPYITYDQAMTLDQTMVGALLQQKAVCAGYASATQYILHCVGIKAGKISGNMWEGGSHAWNIVQLDGKYYHMDTTHGDATSTTMAEHEKIPPVHYEYFAMTQEEVLRTRNIDNTFALPLANTMNCNYFVREGLYFTDYSVDLLKPLFIQAYHNGQNYVSFQFSDKSTYDRAISSLFGQNGEIWEVMEALYAVGKPKAKETSIYHTDSEEFYTVTVYPLL